MYLMGLYLITGTITGFLTGLLGGGSGPMLIPILAALFVYQGVSSELMMRLAVGTSLSIGMVSMLASIHVHSKHLVELKSIIKLLLPGSMIGSLIGVVSAAYLSGHNFKILFGFVVLCIAFRTIFDQHFAIKSPSLPDNKKLFALSLLMGIIATCFGVGMGPLCVPLMKRYGYSISKSIAIATFIGGALVIFAAVGFIIIGHFQSNLPAYSIGYIYLPMLVGIGIPSIFSARIGAKLTYKLDAKNLKIIFSVFLVIVGTIMILGEHKNVGCA